MPTSALIALLVLCAPPPANAGAAAAMPADDPPVELAAARSHHEVPFPAQRTSPNPAADRVTLLDHADPHGAPPAPAVTRTDRVPRPARTHCVGRFPLHERSLPPPSAPCAVPRRHGGACEILTGDGG